jgi:hypothetical protein
MMGKETGNEMRIYDGGQVNTAASDARERRGYDVHCLLTLIITHEADAIDRLNFSSLLAARSTNRPQYRTLLEANAKRQTPTA